MKKNVMMRVASVLLIAVMMTTCAISGTFAKYVTSNDASDSARVAKWGVVVTGNSDLFAEAYDKDDTLYAGAQTVITSGSYANVNDLVAPGTEKNDVAVIKITGTPEVAARVNYVGTVTLEGWELADGSFYCPIIVTVKDNVGAVKAEIDGSTYGSAADFKAAIETYINNFSQDYAPNTNLNAEANAVLSISWSWPFYVSNDRDANDTYLGNCAAGLVDGKTASTINIAVSATVTQID